MGHVCRIDILLIMCLGMTSAVGAAEGTGGGRLMLSTNLWNFGHRWVGVPAQTEIVMKNVGATNLTISDVITSCGCAAAAPKDGGTWQGRVLSPGTEEKMVIAFNTARPVKDVARTITVQTDDPKEPRSIIHIKGAVQNPFEGKPEDGISFGRLSAGAKRSKEIELTNVTGKPLRLKLRPPATDAPFDIQLTEVQSGRVYKLSAATRTPLNAGTAGIEIQLETGLAEFPLQNVAVTAFVPAPVFVQPTKLFTDPAKPQQRLLRLSYEATKPLQIKEIRSTHPALIKAELMPRPNVVTNAVQEFLDHTLRISLPPGSQLPESGTLIELHTNDPLPEYQKFTIPVERLRNPATTGPVAPATVRKDTKPSPRS